MNLALFYDTETTGPPLFSEPSEDPRQPHMVQLAAALTCLDTRKVIASMDVIIRPNGWTIPDDVALVHGITTEHAMDVGIAEETALDMLLALWGESQPTQRTVIGHNESFDRRIVRIAIKRHIDPLDQGRAVPLSDLWKAGAGECTQVLSTPILKLPPTAKMIAANRKHHKSANLGEAYQYFTGKPLENAHSALADVQACMAVYFAIKGPTVAAAMPADALAGA